MNTKMEKQKTKKLIQEIKDLRNENFDLYFENKKLKEEKKILSNYIEELNKDFSEKEIEINKLKLFKINIKSSIRQYLLVINSYIEFYKIYRADNIVQDLQKIYNYLESWSK